jgi:short-subunit dehydrogenase involved in D-alanine esterification of teichoic acids
VKLTQGPDDANNGHTILITGGTSGIGLELAKEFLTLGNTVIAKFGLSMLGKNVDAMLAGSEQ